MYPSPYPYPYQYQPAPAPPPQPSTPKGIGWCVRAFMLHLVALVILALAGLAAFLLLGNVQPGQNPFQLIALALPYYLLLAAWFVIEIVVLIFYPFICCAVYMDMRKELPVSLIVVALVIGLVIDLEEYLS